MPQKHGPGCGCCESCEIFSDDFNRSNSTSLGSDWDERAGSWEISGNALRCTSTSGLAILNTSHPDASPSGIIEVDVYAASSGDVLRIIFDYVNDSNYHFVELNIGFSSTARVWKRTAGSNTAVSSTKTLTSVTDGVTYAFYLCITGTAVAMTINSNYLSTSSVMHGGDQVGLATGSLVSSYVQFDNFVYGESFTTNEDCPKCQGNCSLCINNETPFELEVTISGISNSSCSFCANLNGTYVLQWSSDNIGVGCFWRYTGAIGCLFNDVTALLLITGGDYKLDVSFNGGGNPPVVFRSASLGTADVDCLSFNSVSLPPIGTPPSCNHLSATCTLSAV